MIAGVDLSSEAIDVVLLDDDTDKAEWLHFPIAYKGSNAFGAARNVRDTLTAGGLTRGGWVDRGVWLVGLEDPYSFNTGTAKALALVTGALLACLPPQGALEIRRTAPNEWQREFLQLGHPLPKGTKQRKELVQRCARAHGFDPGNQDACDAYGIAWATRRLNDRLELRQ
jgi:hypothetical protein